ncbi:glycoside hydrolase family 25 protein [Streptomyces humi]|uniref:glycoside hydrolase family 25 protein n=1 Tax=Streptomyces humi TaxID=1428620 RepID=UPI0019D18D72|nr:glycoside hydrolase family 25 protein [Streptomyces humi]
MATCRGIDLSVYQPAQDWKAREAEGVVFAFAKASEGEHTHDARFAQHITGIIGAGLVPGAYHFAWPNQDVAAEAANYTAAVRPHAGPGFVHWLDLERRSDGANYAGVTAGGIRAYATAWIAQVQAAFPGQRVGVYTSASDLAAGHAPATVPLWYPAYPWSGATPYARAEARPQPSPSGRAPLFWQFTSTPLDRSICYLSESALRAWAAGTETDMPLTTDDVNKVAAAVVAKLVAGGGVLETQDVSKVAAAAAKAVLTMDGVIAAPADAPDVKTNPFWALQSYVKDTNARLRLVQATEAAQSAAITQLAGAVAAFDKTIDAAALVASVTAAIEAAVRKVVIHLDPAS